MTELRVYEWRWREWDRRKIAGVAVVAAVLAVVAFPVLYGGAGLSFGKALFAGWVVGLAFIGLVRALFWGMDQLIP